jgi:hypothetical protein
MYLDNIPSKVLSLATGSDFKSATYAECLESIISLREAETNADSELLAIEFRNYHLGMEAEDASFWSKIQAVIRKLMEILKAVASKITAYIQTVPGRIHNFVLRVSNWAAKVGLESKLKNMTETQGRQTLDPEKEKAFKEIEFGPMNFDEILCGANTVQETQDAQNKKAVGGAKTLFMKLITAITNALGTGFRERFDKSVRASLAAKAGQVTGARHEAGKAAGAQAAAASGQKTESLANAKTEEGKIYTVEDFMNEDQQFRENMEKLEDAARAIGETKKYSTVPDLNTAWNMLKTVTNGNIEKQANAVISAIDRSKRGIDTTGRLLSSGFNGAYAAKDSGKVQAIRTAMSECRKVYTIYIKMIVRVDTAAQRCTSNVIRLVKEVMDCYKLNPEAANAPREQVPPDANAQQNNEAPANNTQQTSDNVQDFSHIFDF